MHRNRLCATPVECLRTPEQAQKDFSPEKINATSKSPVGDISVVTLIRTDTTLDHSQKAEKVWSNVLHARRLDRVDRVCFGNAALTGTIFRCIDIYTMHLSASHAMELICSIEHYNITHIGSSSKANRRSRNSAVDDSIGGS